MPMTDEQMMQEMAVFAGLQGKSPAVEKAVPSKSIRGDDTDIMQLFSDSGVNTGDLDAQLEAEKNKRLQDTMEQIRQQQDVARLKMDATEVAYGGFQQMAGIGVGITDVLRNITNGVISLADAAENYAASKGIGAGDLITEANKFDKSFNSEYLDDTGKISRAVTNFAAPMLTAVAAGGGVLASAGVNAAYNFFAIDPKSERISDLLKGTRVDEVPIAADVIDYLSTKPDDTELTARFKNMAEGAGIDALLGGMLWGASRGYANIAKAKNPKLIEDAVKEVSAAEKAAATPVTTAAQAAINSSDAAVSTTVKDGGPLPVQPQAPVDAELPLFQRQWANYFDESPGVRVEPTTGNVSVRLGDDQVVQYLSDAVKNPDVALALRTPVTDEELIKGAQILKNDPEVLNRLATIGQGAYVPNSDDMMALKFVVSKADEAMQESAVRALADTSDAGLVTFARDTENYLKILALQTGAASEQGRTLRVHQVLANQAGLGVPEALAAIGAQGRAKLVDGLMTKYGGKENIKSMAENVNFLKEMAQISKTPNTAFKVKMGEVLVRTKWDKVENAIAKVALNGMLSSPATWGRAFISNAATTTKTVIDNYVSVGVGKVLRTEDAKTLAEANAHMSASMLSLLESIKPAAESIWSGVPANTKIVKQELVDAAQSAPLMEDVAEKAGAAWVEKLGVPVQTAVETPSRVLIGVDSYWQRVNSQGYIASEAIRAGMSQNLEGDALETFVKAFREKPPASVIEAADQLAATNTMAKQLDGFAASIDQAMDGASQYVPFARVILPFMKTGMNIVEYTVKNSPLAPILSQDFRMSMAMGGRARDEALAKVASSSAAIGGLMYLAQQGMIEGDPTENPQFQRAFKDNQNIPNGPSVKVGDTWVSLKGLEPLSTAVNVAALLTKSAGYVSQGEYDDMATAARIMIADAVGPEGITTGLSDILKLADPNTDAKSYLANVATRFVPFGAGLRDVREMVDPKVRSTMPMPATGKTAELQEFYSILKNRLSNTVPYLSKTLPVDRNVWGEALKLPSGIGPDAISPMATSTGEGLPLKRVFEAMDDFYETNHDVVIGINKLNVQMPMKSMKNPMADVQYPFTPQEYSAYVLLNAGINPSTGDKLLGVGTLKERVQQVVSKYDAVGKKASQFDADTYRRMTGELSAIFLQHKQIADKMILKFGDVQRKMADQATRKNNEGVVDGGQ